MPNKRALVVSLAGLAILLLGAAAWLAQDVLTRQAAEGGGAALVGGPFELTDQSGATRTEQDFAGSWMLVYFGYTYCPDVCPTTLLAITQALDDLEETDPALAGQVVPIFITVDPERDTVEVLKGYAEHFHPRLVALTGSAEQIAAAAKAYRVYYRKAETEDSSDYLMDHSSFIYLMGPDGAYVRHYSHDATAADIATGLREELGKP